MSSSKFKFIFNFKLCILHSSDSTFSLELSNYHGISVSNLTNTELLLYDSLKKTTTVKNDTAASVLHFVCLEGYELKSTTNVSRAHFTYHIIIVRPQ